MFPTHNVVIPTLDYERCQVCRKCEAAKHCRYKAIVRFDREEPPYYPASDELAFMVEDENINLGVDYVPVTGDQSAHIGRLKIECHLRKLLIRSYRRVDPVPIHATA